MVVLHISHYRTGPVPAVALVLVVAFALCTLRAVRFREVWVCTVCEF